VIRPAAREDAPAVAELEVRAWRWAYADFVDEADMPTVEEREQRWRTLPLRGASVWDQDGRVVGVVQVGHRDDDAAIGALRGLYVDPPAQGAGIGAALHDHGLNALRAAGFATATLWVFSANGHAREFYAARGWVPDGTQGAWKGVPELRYRTTLER
jgi:GNAT superfamily N-acetyltransferase